MPFCLFPMTTKLLLTGSTLQGKKLLLEEQIFSFKVDPYREGNKKTNKKTMAVLLPLNVYSFTYVSLCNVLKYWDT